MTSSPVALINARLLDPATGKETPGGVMIENGLIVDIGAKVTKANAGERTQVVDCGGGVFRPCLIGFFPFRCGTWARHPGSLPTPKPPAGAGGGSVVVGVA